MMGKLLLEDCWGPEENNQNPQINKMNNVCQRLKKGEGVACKWAQGIFWEKENILCIDCGVC